MDNFTAIFSKYFIKRGPDNSLTTRIGAENVRIEVYQSYPVIDRIKSAFPLFFSVLDGFFGYVVSERKPNNIGLNKNFSKGEP